MFGSLRDSQVASHFRAMLYPSEGQLAMLTVATDASIVGIAAIMIEDQGGGL
jgi:hypothetical protein